MTGLSFWARGYCVSTVGLDEGVIRRYIQEQEKLECGQMSFDLDEAQTVVSPGHSRRNAPLWGAS